MKKIYIGLFAVLYLAVAFTSTLHAVEFFGLANEVWLSVILAISFEIGQAAVLFELLTSSNDRKKIMPWVLMAIFTLVQVLGNVYSSYKYILLNSPENLRYFKEPIFIWTQLPDNQATVIVTYIIGAILPVCALLLTSMITNQLDNNKTANKSYNDENEIEEKPKEIIEENNIENTIEKEPTFEEKETSIETPKEQELISEEPEKNTEEPEKNTEEPEKISEEQEKNTEEPEKISEEVEEIFNNKDKSHFINL